MQLTLYKSQVGAYLLSSANYIIACNVRLSDFALKMEVFTAIFWDRIFWGLPTILRCVHSENNRTHFTFRHPFLS